MPRNLIVVVFDTLRYDAVNGDLARMPNMRRFAESAVSFSNAWGEGLPTIPFRRALHTGFRSFPWRHNMADRGSHPNILGWHAVPEDQTTAAEYLFAHGYATQLVADVWHMFKATQNFTRGFVSWDYVRGQEGDTYRFGADSLKTAADIDPTRMGPAAYLYQVKDRRSDDDYFVAQVLDRAAGFVEDTQGAGPYCLWVESFSPHEFWDPPLRYADAYFQKEGLTNYIVPQLLNRIPAGPAGQAMAAQRRNAQGVPILQPGEEPSPDDIARTTALYQGYCTFCDERFGRFMDRLERSGALNDSVVAVLSDHGTEVWDQGQFGKAGARMHPYNTQINLMLRHPDGEGAGQRVDAFVQNQDILPTLLGMLEIAHPRMDGDDLWPLVSGAAGAEQLRARDHVVIGWDVYASVRDREWNLLVNTTEPSKNLQLFHLTDDPEEKHNVAADYPQVIRTQIARLEAVLGAPLPANYTHRPKGGFAATPGALRQKRAQAALPGERWSGSNQV
jgi:arylsulfatase A-like enzyme